MTELTAKTPCDGLLPITIGDCTLSEVEPDRITSVAFYDGQEKAVGKALGLPIPPPNRTTGKGNARAIWFGQGVAMVLGAPVPGDVAKYAAITDQSDAWAVMRLEGAAAEDILARLVPVDLRLAKFAVGSTARTELQHMMASITRVDEHAFEVMVMRSFARTAVHDLEGPMRTLSARP
ncbi:sarcosine oxidase subunit gamma [Aliiroseovarius sp. YM-037]|uniref:sarcosine oxidase subunit gamma n=1 Tax=Aliiroseovarius sp. YM-037 TaxID=3341728 RepID=UPI003A80C50C